MESLVDKAGARADDVLNTLSSFERLAEAGGPNAMLSQFERVSKQLNLLQECVTEFPGAARDSNRTMLEDYFAVPSALAGSNLQRVNLGTEDPSRLPALLATALDKEQTDQAPLPSMFADHASADDHSAFQAHNESIEAALAHLTDVALRADLPGAAELSGNARRFKRAKLAA